MQNFYEKVESIADQTLAAIYQKDLDKAKDLMYSLIVTIKILKQTPVEVISNKNNQRTYDSHEETTRHNMHVVGYCFSTYEHTSLYPAYTQDKALNLAAQIIGVKKNTLKQTRDAFDGHNNSPRKGYWQSKLPTALQKIKDKYDKIKKETVITEAKKILNL